MIRPMRQSEIEEVSALLRDSYTCLGEREGLSEKQPGSAMEGVIVTLMEKSLSSALGTEDSAD